VDLPYPQSVLTELELPQLRARRSEKWRRYPDDVLPLWVAEMDTPLAAPISAALHEAVDLGDTGYAHPGRLAEAFAGFAFSRFGWWPDPAQMTLVGDVSLGIEEVLRVVTRPGDAVLLNTPAYPPFFAHIPHVGRRVVESPLSLDADGRYHLDLERLDRDFAAPDVTAYVLVNPHNPTGLVFDREVLLAVAEVAAKHRVRVLADEIHAPLVYPRTSFVPYLSLPGVDGFAFESASKAWNLAGLKAALVVAGPEAAEDLGRIMPESQSAAGMFGVIASEAAFRYGGPWLDSLLTGLDANRRLLQEVLAAELPEVRYRVPDATFLAWLDCRALQLGDDPAEFFLNQARVAVNPGPSFGAVGRGFVRLNFATHPRLLTTAVHEMGAAVSRSRSGYEASR
jgi:cysteine-S-conjugate beta-lyase